MEVEEAPPLSPALAIEALLTDWFEGRNANGLQFGVAEQADLDYFVAYMKALGSPASVSELLPRLLSSPYLRALRPPRRLPQCVPTVHFRPIKAPYERAYRNLLDQYKLHPFIGEGGSKKYLKSFKADAMANGAGADIYLCFIQFGSVYAVNLLPAPGIH
jgi:hypothetical protein